MLKLRSIAARCLVVTAIFGQSARVLCAQPQENSKPISVLTPPRTGLESVPLPLLGSVEESVAEQIRSAQASVADLFAQPKISDPDLSQAYGNLGRLYHAYEFNDSAEACYLNASRLGPKDYRWLHLLGQLNQKAGNLERSASFYEAARKIAPDYVATATNLGSVYLQLNRLVEAQKEFQAALASDPGCAAAHHGLGEVALAQQRFSNAIDHFVAALNRVPQANRIHYSLAMAYRGKGDLEKARVHLKQRGTVGVRAEDPLMGEVLGLLQGERVHLLQGRLAFHAGQFEDAARAFAKAVQAEPDSVRARVNLGSALGQMGDTQGAMEQLRAVLVAEPRNRTAHFNLGTILVRQGDHSQAINHFLAVLESDPADLEANRELAKSLLQVGQDDEAVTYLSKAVSLAPGDEASLIRLASLLVGKNHYRETLDLLEEAHGRFPKRVRTANALARLLAGCPDAKLRDGQRALQLAMQAYGATKLLVHGETVAMALAQLGRCQEAADWQRRMLDVAEQAKEPQLTARLRQELARYERGSPCAPAARQTVVSAEQPVVEVGPGKKWGLPSDVRSPSY